MEQMLLAIVVGAGIAVVTVIFVSVFVMVTLQRLRRPEYIHRVARKYSTSPLKLR